MTLVLVVKWRGPRMPEHFLPVVLVCIVAAVVLGYVLGVVVTR